MSTSSSSTSFFSFGPEDSFISKSFEGLRYRNLPRSLHDLLVGGSVINVHWASLGPVADSWVLSFKDASGKNNLGWGATLPARIATVLSKLAPSPYFRIFLGPEGSFIAWDPSFIRWAGLPPSLEDAIQSWLSPSGWKAGPPRMASWGPHDAFFAMSEYGDVAYRLGDEGKDEAWPTWKETVEEWKGEQGFAWSEIAYLSLDPTSTDQFIAIRNDGTWSGAIDDVNENALDAFARNFFRAHKPKPAKSSPKPQKNGRSQAQPNGASKSPDKTPDPAIQALYEQWATETASRFASALAANGASKRAPKKLQIRNQAPQPSTKASIPSSMNSVPEGKLLSSFPYLPAAVTTCRISACVTAKADPAGLRACKHDVERMLRASGLYSYEWLRQERIRWHPDRFGRLCEEDWREEGRRLAEEMFKVIDALIAEAQRSKVDGAKGGW